MSIVNRCAYLSSDHKFDIQMESVPRPGKEEVTVNILANRCRLDGPEAILLK